jgi:hypothetical protein
MTIAAARDLRTVFAERTQDPRDYVIEIRNAADEFVYELPFTAALDQQDPQLPRRFPH